MKLCILLNLLSSGRDSEGGRQCDIVKCKLNNEKKEYRILLSCSHYDY